MQTGQKRTKLNTRTKNPTANRRALTTGARDIEIMRSAAFPEGGAWIREMRKLGFWRMAR